MLYQCVCIQCFEDHNIQDYTASGEVLSDLVAICECKNGHITLSSIKHDLFDVLFRSGVKSYINGFYSESVMSFTSALERAFETYLKVFMIKSGVDKKEIDDYWKEIKNQSERQYGAFCTAYKITTGEVWKADSNQVSFRNNVIHKGYIATSSKTAKYADYITQRLNQIMASIKFHLSSEHRELSFYNQEKQQPTFEKLLKQYPNASTSGSAQSSLLQWNHAGHEDVSFSEIIEIAKTIKI